MSYETINSLLNKCKEIILSVENVKDDKTKPDETPELYLVFESSVFDELLKEKEEIESELTDDNQITIRKFEENNYHIEITSYNIINIGKPYTFHPDKLRVHQYEKNQLADLSGSKQKILLGFAKYILSNGDVLSKKLFSKEFKIDFIQPEERGGFRIIGELPD